MTLQEIIASLNLSILTDASALNTGHVPGGYTSDLLSCVMTGAKSGDVWVTLQAHLNVVAVASLLELSAVIITENAQPDADTIQRANLQGVTLLSTPLDSYTVVGRLWDLGIQTHQPA